jgi:hypothetical protein
MINASPLTEAIKLIPLEYCESELRSGNSVFITKLQAVHSQEEARQFIADVKKSILMRVIMFLPGFWAGAHRKLSTAQTMVNLQELRGAPYLQL